MAKKTTKVTALQRIDSFPMANDVEHGDGFVNALVGVGDLGADKRLGGTGANPRNVFRLPTMSRADAVNLWRANDVAARIVEDVPNEMHREGWDVLVAGDPDAAEKINALQDEMEISETLRMAECRARAEGGSLVLLGVNDGTADLAEPLNVERVRSFDWLNIVGPDEVAVYARYDDPTQRNFGKPLLYQIKTQITGNQGNRLQSGLYIHESRCIRFDGVMVGGQRWQQSNLGADGWGDSVLLRPHNVLRDFEMSWSAVAILMVEISQGVFKFKNLAEMMAADNDGAVVARMRMANLSKSIVNALMMDSEETFERVSVQLAGVPEVLQQLTNRLAGASDMPVTRLMGQSPAGLNATGASDIRFYYDRIAAHQRRSLQPKLNLITRLQFLTPTGPTKGKEPDNWRIKFRPLWQMTKTEEATLRLTMAQADEKNIANNVYTPEEAAASRYGGDEFNVDTALDIDAREKLRAALEAGADKDQDAALNGAQVASMLEIVRLVAVGTIPRDSGVAMIVSAFPVDKSEAEKIMGKAGAGFVAVAPPPASVQTPAPGTTAPRQTLNAEP